jgi:hypothetical protein
MTGEPKLAVVRFLVPTDVDTLIALEEETWTAEQSTSAAEMTRRIEAYPRLSVGAFCPRTGQALASLFMKPITREEMRSANTWLDCARVDSAVPPKTRALFGISLSSVDAAAVDGLLGFFWPHALKAGWRDIYLGSPVPGLRSWRQANPQVSVEEYVRERRNGRPRDPQLRYYHRKGFRHIVAWKPDYFPHEASLDHGVVLRGRIPLSGPAPLWRVVPLSWLQRMRSVLFLALRATAS